MTSPKQIAANRRNALFSSGPVTAEGKRRSRCNALRHGLTAETVIPVVEDREDYEAFEAAVTADYNAESAVQRELVLRLASILWRLRRASGIETALFDALADDCADHPSPQPHLSLDYAREVVDLRPREAGLHPQKRIADTFLRLAEQPTYAFDRLSRYEYLLWRQARQIIVTLDVSQRCKRELRVRPSLSFYGPDRRSEEA
jgi:hypothetical protein